MESFCSAKAPLFSQAKKKTNKKRRTLLMFTRKRVIKLTMLSTTKPMLLSTPMGVDYVVIGFDMEVQALVTHNAA